MTNGVVCCLTLVKVQSTPTDRGHVKCESPRHPVGMDAGRPLLTPWAKDENPFDALRN